MDAAFVKGSYPRHSFPHSFSGFTAGAARLAQRQSAVTTNAALGTAIGSLVPTRRNVWVYAYAPHGHAVGATADVLLVLQAAKTDGKRVEITVTGQLDLTRDRQHRWRVFGFDLRQGTAAPGTYAATKARQRHRAQLRARRLHRQHQHRHHRHHRHHHSGGTR